MRRKLLLLLPPFLLSGCAATRNPLSSAGGSGFWMGLWHGLIIPISFVISLFNNRAGIYQVLNDGVWYDFGFLIGVLLPGVSEH
jgi:hypothetical protein